MGVKMEKGDFFRVVTRTTCSEPTGAGTMENPESNCGSFNPGNIWYHTHGSGGSGGTPTYFWQKSTTNSSSGFSTISGVSTVGYNPPSTITQTTWYRRGYYRCDISAAIYTPTIEKTVITEPTGAGTIANPESNCGSFNPGNIWYNTLASGGSGGTPTYFWEKSTTNSSSGFSTISGVSTVGYDPPSTITQTTWYRRGAYRCDISAAIYTSAIEKTVNSVPSAPTTGSVTQPTCATSTGSFQINGYNASNTYVFTPSVASTSGSGLVTANAGTYTFTVTNAVGCISSASSNITVNAQPATPSAPTAGAITQPTCAVATGSFTIASYNASSSYTFTPIGPAVDGSGVVTLAAGATYTFTETNALGCESTASADVVIDAQPATPSAPVAGTITQPSCGVATGSFTIASYNASSTYTFTPSRTNDRWKWSSNPSCRNDIYFYRNECRM